MAATDGTHTDKVTVGWTKSTGATGYKVYEGSNLLDTLGDIAVYDDNAAPAPTITGGSTVATDGDFAADVALSLSGALANNGASRTWKGRCQSVSARPRVFQPAPKTVCCVGLQDGHAVVILVSALR